MTKQMMFYEHATPLSASRHADLSVEPAAGYGFAAHASAVPLMAVEFLAAATEYAIVFSSIGDELFPSVVLGLRSDQNAYVGQDEQWQAKYVPAFVRRYPFVFAHGSDSKTLALCVDESFVGVNRDGRGKRLFDEAGKPTDYTQQVLKFLQDFQAHFQRTRQFCKRLKDLQLLEPSAVRVAAPDGKSLAVGGFSVVDRKKIKALPAEQLAELVNSDELELLYLHLYSLRNFSNMKNRMAEGQAGETGDATPSALAH
jgi:hypothetical protein